MSKPWLAVLSACALLACHGGNHTAPSDGAAADDGPVLDGPASDAPADAGVNPAGTIGRYEAEDTTLVGGAAVVGAADLGSRSAGDLGGEASVRRAVTLASAGDGIAFAVLPQTAGANAVVVRFSLPDAAAGGGQTSQLAFTATGSNGATLASATFTLTSRYAWGYGSAGAGTKIYNVPANAGSNEGAANPIHLYDESQLLLATALPAGATVTLALPAATPANPPVTVDFVELEIAPPPLAQPADLLSITDPTCGAIALDTHQTGRAFDGSDDAAYASTFVAATGINPFNPTGSNGVQSAGTDEKDYYTSGSGDVLQDGSAGSASANLSMFALADHNQAAIAACIAVVDTGNSAYDGIWIPPGRFYARGTITVPDGIAIRGAGIWYAKLVAVDTAPPTAVTDPSNGLSGIASVSGDLRFTNAAGGTSGAAISDLALFGNMTQRDAVDRVTPIGVIGAFTASTFERIWVEHYEQGLVMNGSSSGDTLSELRVRDTFADGIDLYGEASASAIGSSHTRSTGDDGFAVWSQSGSSASTGNSVTDCVAELPWWGDGFAVYGGANATLDGDTAIDTLSIAGMKLSTEFVPASLPPTFAMTGIAVTNAALVRCGGNGFDNRSGALQIGPQDEAIAGMTIDHVAIDDPTFAAIDVRVLSSVGKVTTPGTLDVAISNAEILDAGAAGCAAIGAAITGSGALDEACACEAAGSAALACAIDNASPATFAIAASCSAATCP